jgi:hypothetical protein
MEEIVKARLDVEGIPEEVAPADPSSAPLFIRESVEPVTEEEDNLLRFSSRSSEPLPSLVVEEPVVVLAEPPPAPPAEKTVEPIFDYIPPIQNW